MNSIDNLIEYAQANEVKNIILDTPIAAVVPIIFMKKWIFLSLKKDELPIAYEYVDRNPLLFMKTLKSYDTMVEAQGVDICQLVQANHSEIQSAM